MKNISTFYLFINNIYKEINQRIRKVFLTAMTNDLDNTNWSRKYVGLLQDGICDLKICWCFAYMKELLIALYNS